MQMSGSVEINGGTPSWTSEKCAFPERECQPNLNLQSREPSVAIPERLEVKLEGSRYCAAWVLFLFVDKIDADVWQYGGTPFVAEAPLYTCAAHEIGRM